MPSIVSLQNVHKSFHHLDVLSNVSCAVNPGEVVSLVGPSGCGKSTVLRLMAGIETPEVGQIERNFQRAGFVFQEPRLLPWRTALENVVLVLLDRHPASVQREKQAAALLQRVGLAGFEHYFPSQLSGGMRQRVAIARALAVDPDFVLLDEPFSALDFALRLSLIEFLRSLLTADNKTAVYVTHDVREALLLSDRLVVFSSLPGRIKQVFDVRHLRSVGHTLPPALQAIEAEIVDLLLAD